MSFIGILTAIRWRIDSCWAKYQDRFTNAFWCSNNSRNHKFLRLYCLLTLTRKFWLQWSEVSFYFSAVPLGSNIGSLLCLLERKAGHKCSSPFIFDQYWAGDETIITLLSTRFQMAGPRKNDFNYICHDVSTMRLNYWLRTIIWRFNYLSSINREFSKGFT